MTTGRLKDFGEDESFFVNDEILSQDWVPDRLPERIEELNEIQSALSPVARGQAPKNFFLYGQTGLGKSAGVQFQLKRLHDYVETLDDVDMEWAKIECVDCNTSYSAVSKIYRVFARRADELDPRVSPPEQPSPAGRRLDDLYRVTYEQMNRVAVNLEINNHFPDVEIGAGDSGDESYQQLVKKVEALDQDQLTNKFFIIILDEVDSIQEDDSLFYRIPRSRTNENNLRDDIKLSFAGISNDLKYIDNLSAPVRSSLCERELMFLPYDSSQLASILRRRAIRALRDTRARIEVPPVVDGEVVEVGETLPTQKTTRILSREEFVRLGEPDGPFADEPFEAHECELTGVESDVIDESTIRYCAAVTSRKNGDARLAIRLLSDAAELAEEQGDGTITDEHAMLAEEKLKIKNVVEYVRDITTDQQLMVLTFFQLYIGDELPASTRGVHRQYTALAREQGLDTNGIRWARRQLSDLVDFGILGCERVPIATVDDMSGLGGATNVYELDVPPKETLQAISDGATNPANKELASELYEFLR